MYKLNLAWLYPDLMSTYGDRGNVIILKYRAQNYNVELNVVEIGIGDDSKLIQQADLIFMGGAQDRQQEIVAQDMFVAGKQESLRHAIERGTPGLFICGAYQFLGKYYQLPTGERLRCLGILDFYTVSPSGALPRLIGNIVTKIDTLPELIGFENHGGRTYLGNQIKPFAQVKLGKGNNGEDGTEGAVYKNTIGTYLHGPILSKNPYLADDLLKRAFMLKYGEQLEVKRLTVDEVIDKCRRQLFYRLGL